MTTPPPVGVVKCQIKWLPFAEHIQLLYRRIVLLVTVCTTALLFLDPEIAPLVYHCFWWAESYGHLSLSPTARYHVTPKCCSLTHNYLMSAHSKLGLGGGSQGDDSPVVRDPSLNPSTTWALQYCQGEPWRSLNAPRCRPCGPQALPDWPWGPLTLQAPHSATPTSGDHYQRWLLSPLSTA